jgi:hypothetical protein
MLPTSRKFISSLTFRLLFLTAIFGLALGVVGRLSAKDGSPAPTAANLDDTAVVALPAAEDSRTLPIVRSTVSDPARTSRGSLYLFLPITLVTPPEVILDPIPRPDPSNSWTLTWAVVGGTSVDEYEVQESHDPAFATFTSLAAGPETTLTRTMPLSTSNVYYYRVRAVTAAGSGPWSNVQYVYGGYRDDFNDPASGWAIRREDTDDHDNNSYYDTGNLRLEINGRWDYQVTSPLALPPTAPYRIDARMMLEGPDNLHTYGLIFGGNWDGTQCPNADYSSCFQHYYRMTVVWWGAPSTLKFDLKRIDYHDAENNHGRGVTLLEYIDVSVNNPSQTWQDWAVEVYPTGTIKIFVNGSQVGEASDTTYINDPYFGLFSATDEYAGLDTLVDWYQVTALPAVTEPETPFVAPEAAVTQPGSRR